MARCVASHGIDFLLCVFRKGEREKGSRGDCELSPLLPCSPAPLLLLKLLLPLIPISATLKQEACYV